MVPAGWGGDRDGGQTQPALLRCPQLQCSPRKGAGSCRLSRRGEPPLGPAGEVQFLVEGDRLLSQSTQVNPSVLVFLFWVCFVFVFVW